jgi:arylsulfatase A-like enzyme
MSPTRRDVLKTAALGSLALAAEVKDALAQQRAAPPNIIYIMADDLGYADVACYGRPDVKTPNIDRIAARGVRFLQGYANSAVCTATRVALITGRYQYRLRLGLEEPLGTANPRVGLPPEHPTIASQMKKAGYGTTLIGKWHLGDLPNFGPLKSGYDHFYGFHSGGIDYYRHEGTDHKPDFWDDDMPI